MSKWSQQDYEMVAQILSDHVTPLADQPITEQGVTQMETLISVTTSFGMTFEADNPRFDKDRFLRAAGLG